MEATQRVSPSTVPADHPGVNELFSLLAYGEVAAFYRLTDEARMAPDLRGRINMARMAAAEMGHYDLVRDTLEARGVDALAAMAPTRRTGEVPRLTMPSTWLEGCQTTSATPWRPICTGDRGLAARRGAMWCSAVLAETGHSPFVVARAFSGTNLAAAHRLALWSLRCW